MHHVLADRQGATGNVLEDMRYVFPKELQTDEVDAQAEEDKKAAAKKEEERRKMRGEEGDV